MGRAVTDTIECICLRCEVQGQTDAELCGACGYPLLLEGRYAAVRKLGGGGSSDTFEVIELATGERFAVKALVFERLKDAKALELFARQFEILAGLDEESREKIQGLLSRIQEKGLTEFEEEGHSRRSKGGTKLDPVMAAQLTSFLAEDEKATVAEFFTLNEDILGEQADYNLSAFTKESNDG